MLQLVEVSPRRFLKSLWQFASTPPEIDGVNFCRESGLRCDNTVELCPYMLMYTGGLAAAKTFGELN